jgi:hypothetical protein
MLAKIRTFLQDPTHIVNILTAVTAALTYFQGSELVASNPKAVAGIGTALGVTNVVLRLLTQVPAAPAAAPASDPKAAPAAAPAA